MLHLRKIFIRSVLVFTIIAFHTICYADECITPIDDGYGDSGSYEVGDFSFNHPAWRNGPAAHIFYPKLQTTPKSVILFCHGFFAIHPKSYKKLIHNIVSRGDVVFVYMPYKILKKDYKSKYNQMVKGFKTAVKKYKKKFNMDLTRVGIIGHSFGAGAVPAIFKRTVVDKNWGTNGAFMFCLAPFYSFGMTDEDYAQIPAKTKVVIEVFEDDNICSHEIGIHHIWNRLASIPKHNKQWLVLKSVSKDKCRFIADHYISGKSNDFGRWGVSRRIHAVINTAFYNDSYADELAFGHGSTAQLFMGYWMDNTRVEGLIQMDKPVSLTPSGSARHTLLNHIDSWQ